MKFLVIVLVIAIVLTGCGPASSTAASEKAIFSKFYSTSEQHANEVIERIFQIVEEENLEAMRSLFSENTLNSAEDLDSQIEAFFEFYSGNLISYEANFAYSGSRRDKNAYSKFTFGTYTFTTTEEDYRLYIRFYTVDFPSEEKVGIQTIYIIKAEDTNLDHPYWGDGNDTPGITIEKRTRE